MRLTRRSGGTAYWKTGENAGYRPDDVCFKSEVERLDKLAAYEDTGLSPEEFRERTESVLELYGKQKPYADAEEQGRLVILPCKMGDKVRDKIADHIFTIQTVELGHKAGTLFRCGNPGTCNYMSFYDFEIGTRIEILTREEAESAMKGGQDDGT